MGYHEPIECQASSSSSSPTPTADTTAHQQQQQQLLAVIAPKDRPSAEAVASIMKPTEIPIVAYTFESAQALLDSGHKRVLSAAPSLDGYLELLGQVLIELNGSNLVY